MTISDIAKKVGVSKTTISRYLNGNFEFMSEKTRERISSVIEECGYVPNSVARTLKLKKSNLIGVVVNSLQYQVGAQTVTEINRVCTENGYSTVVWCTDDDPAKEAAAIRNCIHQQVDGMIIRPCSNDVSRYIRVCESGMPVVLCTRKLDGWPYGCVYAKHDEMIRQMLEHLKTEGFEKVLFVMDTNRFVKKGMGEAFEDNAEKLFDMPRKKATVLVSDDQQLLRKAFDRFLSEYPGEAKAVMSVNTHTLFMILKEIERRGLRIPDEIGVCGYDAIGWSELVYPGISCIKQPMDEIGRLSAEKLLECLKNDTVSEGSQALDSKLFFRPSTILGKK